MTFAYDFDRKHFAKRKGVCLIASLAMLMSTQTAAMAATEIGNRCRVISNSIPFSQRQRGEDFRASAVFAKRLLMKQGEKALILGTLRSTAPSNDKSIDKMLFGALLASFDEKPTAFTGNKPGETTYTISDDAMLRDHWLQISPALAYNVARETNKYGVVSLHSVYEAKWSGEHWITVLGYAAHTRPVKPERIPVSAHQRSCDLVAIKLD